MITETQPTLPVNFDAFIPPQMVAKAEEIGVVKATMGWRNTFPLGVLAGAFIPIGLFVKASAPFAFWDAIGKITADYANLTWGNLFFVNLLPVTLGNIIGGSVMVGLVYWFIYIRKRVVPRPE